MTEPVIYSLGSSTRTPEEFIGVLHAYGIKTLVDVRSFPTSAFGGHSPPYQAKNIPGELHNTYEVPGRHVLRSHKKGTTNPVVPFLN